MNSYKEIKRYIKNNELDLEKIINEYSSYENSLYNYDKIDLLNDNVEKISKYEENGTNNLIKN